MDNVDQADVDKYYLIERKNLIHLLKLSIKNFIDYALSLTSPLDEECPPLYQLFVILEQVLKHGLRDKNGYLNLSKTDFFDVIRVLSKELEWTKDLLESINNMSHLKTLAGRGRAFLRLTMMQKKTHVLFMGLVEHRDKVRSFYNPHALLLGEDAHIISGLLVGLNVIDCNLCLKENDLDNLPQVVQLAHYLKDGNYLDTPTPPPSPQAENKQRDYQHILEQKSYVEEINEKLRADFQAVEKKHRTLKVENEVLVAEVTNLKGIIEEIGSERDCLRQKLDESGEAHKRRIQVEQADIAVERETYAASRNGLNNLYLLAKEELAQTSGKIAELERDVEIERRIKSDLTKANSLLEKDLQDKEDTIDAVRKQCAEVKKLNLNMLSKVQESDKKLSEREISLKQLESRTHSSTSQLSDLTTQMKELDVQNEDLKRELDEYKKKCYDMDTTLDELQTERNVEKEWRENLQKQSIQDREDVTRMRAQATHLEDMKSALKQYQRENEDLKRSCNEQERALVELGDHLSKSKVKAEELQSHTDILKESKWTEDKEIENCQQCSKGFSVARRRHHCRNCGGIFCHQCSDNTMPLPSSSRPLRVCDRCNEMLLQRYQKTS